MTFASSAVMHRAWLVIAPLLAASAMPSSAWAQADPLAPMAWLAGCWVAQDAEPGTVEQWMPLAAGSMLGMARTVRGGRTVEHEFMQIRLAADGTPIFIALPSRRAAPVTFRLLRASPTELVFENLEHDFPQRVIYRQETDTSLRARIEGLRNGVLRGIEFPMRRSPCDKINP